MHQPLLLLMIAATLPSAVQAAEFTEHHAHEHGKAALEIAADRNALIINIDSPAQNLLGFEHAPRTAEETKRSGQVTALLALPDKLFKPNAEAQCQLSNSTVDAPAWQKNSEHADYEVSYTYTCKQPLQLRSIEVDIAALFLPATSVTVAMSTDKGQRQKTLPALKTVLSLR